MRHVSRLSGSSIVPHTGLPCCSSRNASTRGIASTIPLPPDNAKTVRLPSVRLASNDGVAPPPCPLPPTPTTAVAWWAPETQPGQPPASLVPPAVQAMRQAATAALFSLPFGLSPSWAGAPELRGSLRFPWWLRCTTRGRVKEAARSVRRRPPGYLLIAPKGGGQSGGPRRKVMSSKPGTPVCGSAQPCPCLYWRNCQYQLKKKEGK